MFDSILYRPVKGTRSIDRRLTQERWERPEFYKPLWWPYHLWLDYSGPNAWDKVAIYSATDWIVEQAWWDDTGFWNRIAIRTWAYLIYYCHLDSISVNVWQTVKALENIGVMGTTGRSSGVHLHFSVKWPWGNKKELWRINPTPFIRDWVLKPIEVQEQDPLIQQLIDNWIYNWQEWDGVTHRTALMVAKLYDKLLKLTWNK